SPPDAGCTGRIDRPAQRDAGRLEKEGTVARADIQGNHKRVLRAQRESQRSHLRTLVAVTPDGLAERDGQVVARSAESWMHRQRATEHRRSVAVTAERHVAEPRARERAEVVPVARERLLAVGDRALVVLGDVADGRSLVPPLGERGGLGDHPREDRLGSNEIAALHGRHSLAQQRVDLAVARAVPHLPQRRLGAGGRRRVASDQRLQPFVFGHGAPSLRRVVAKSKMRLTWRDSPGRSFSSPALLRARGGGAIVNTASIAGLRGSPNIIAYTASKHAVVGMTRTASLELARHNIRVNAVCPAPIETPMAQQLETEIKRERLTATIPMRRYGAPEEVAALVAFLASPDATYITGAIYTVDGGAMA